MQNTDLLLVNPNNRSQTYSGPGYFLPAIEPPLWTGLIAGFMRAKGFSVKIIDAEAENLNPDVTAEKIAEFNPLLVGISLIGANPSASSTPKMTAASKVLNNLKNKTPGIKTFFYGIHPSALPERTLKEEPLDFICRGECFYTVFELLTILKSHKKTADYKIKGLCYKNNGNVIVNGWGKLVDNLDLLPFAAWDLLPMNKYRAHNWHCFGNIDRRKPYAAIYTSLGCPFDCTYCNIHALYNGKPGIRFRSPDKVAEEISLLVENYRIRNIKIIDEIFTLREAYVAELCDLIVKRRYDLNMWAYARIDTVNEKMLKKMKRAGINWLCYGIESFDRKVRDNVGKGSFEESAVRKVVEMTRSAGINIIGNFMFGLPEDSLETMQETLRMAKELDLEYVNFYVTMAYPGSQLYEAALKKGSRLPEKWCGYSQLSKETFPLATNYLSGTDILRFRDKAFKEYYANARYLKIIKEKFGSDTVKHINKMLKRGIPRKLF